MIFINVTEYIYFQSLNCQAFNWIVCRQINTVFVSVHYKLQHGLHLHGSG